MDIKILTPGCCTRHSLQDRVNAVLESTGVEATVERVSDMEEVMRYNVMSTPALVIDGEVQVAGRSPTVEEIEDLLVSS